MTLPYCRSFTIDVGFGGFSADVLRVLPPGTSVEGKLETTDRTFPYVGVVAWAKEGAPHMGLRGRMGISFTHPISDLRGVLGARTEAQGS